MKRTLLLALFLLLILSLCACGKGNEALPPAAGKPGAAQAQSQASSRQEENTQEAQSPETAVDFFTRQIEQDPESDMAYLGRGDAYAALGDGEKALTDYTAALELRESPEAYLGLVDAQILLHEFEAAQSTAVIGSEKTGDERLKAKYTELKQGNAVDAAGRKHKFSHYTDSRLDWYHITDYVQGNQVYAVTSYNAGGTQTGQIIYEYDEKGNVTLGSHCWYDEGVVRPSVRTYNEQGQLIQRVQQGDSNRYSYGEINEYDPDGQLSRSEFYSRWPDGLYAITYYEWTDFGKRAKETDYNPDGTLQDYTVYEYNDKQQKIKCTYYDSDGSVDFYYTFEYDGNCSLSSETRHEG